jgi:rSAM-associated Gly-rich repeat protein
MRPLKGGSLSLRQKYVDVLGWLLPASVLGVSLTLGLSAPGTARENPIENQPAASEGSVSERLSAIREAVSQIVGSEEEPQKLEQMAWGNWRNGWHNWRNGGWHNHDWHNGGWHNGGWHNGGWHNGGWHNWHNY